MIDAANAAAVDVDGRHSPSFGPNKAEEDSSAHAHWLFRCKKLFHPSKGSILVESIINIQAQRGSVLLHRILSQAEIIFYRFQIIHSFIHW